MTGSPRSGTTLVGKVIGFAPEVFSVYEPMNWDAPHHLPVTERFQAVTEEGPASLQKGLSELCYLGEPLFRTYKAVRGLTEAGRARPELCGRLAAVALRDGTIGAPTRRVCIKDPLALYAAEWFAAHREGQLVLTCREPVGVVSSYLALGWRSDVAAVLRRPILGGDEALHEAAARRKRDGRGDEVGDLVLQWRLLATQTLALSRLVPDAVLLCHEAVCRSPHEAFASLFGRIGLAYDQRVRDQVSSLVNGPRAAARPRVQHDHRRDAGRLTAAARRRLPAEVAMRIDAEAGETWRKLRLASAPRAQSRITEREVAS